MNKEETFTSCDIAVHMYILHRYIQILGHYAPSASYHTQLHKRLIKHLNISLLVVVPPFALYVRLINPTFHENIGVVWPIFD
jgi:hypothetical protein